jgi:hypothetical protein
MEATIAQKLGTIHPGGLMRAGILAMVFVVGCGSDASTGMDMSVAGDLSMDLRGAGCTPGDVSGFTPMWHPPTGPRQGKCTKVQIDNFITNFLQGTPTEQNAYKAANATCFACLVTTGDAANAGAILDLTATVGIYAGNSGGCAALVEGDLGATGCGARLAAVQSCGFAACKTGCDRSSPTYVPDFNQCVDDSAQTSCLSYENAVTPCASAATDAQLKCLSSTWNGDLAGWFGYLGDVFCGPPGDM